MTVGAVRSGFNFSILSRVTESFGPVLLNASPNGHVRSVVNGVSELRVDYGPGYRVYFGQLGAKIVLLLCGGDKSTQTQDVKKAQEY